jgi:hypothetical protein
MNRKKIAEPIENNFFLNFIVYFSKLGMRKESVTEG